MKPSDLPKNAQLSLRISAEVKRILKAMGIRPQALFDRTVDELVGELKIQGEKKAKRASP